MSVATEPRNTFTIEEAAEVLGISRTLAYEAAKTGSLGGVPVMKVGRRLLVPRAALQRVLAGETLLQQEAPVNGR